jgi:hypothetical protein
MRLKGLSASIVGLALLAGCDVSADKSAISEADAITPTPATLQGKDYLSTEFRARRKTNNSLETINKERQAQVEEEKGQ